LHSRRFRQLVGCNQQPLALFGHGSHSVAPRLAKPSSMRFAFDFQTAPHKSVTLAAEFAEAPAEAAALWHAMDRANDATMRLIARDLGWARRGKGGEEGAERGSVGWISFRHFTAR